jgi:hypothetical protein
MSGSGYTIEDLIKAGQAQAEENEKEEEMEYEGEKKKKEEKKESPPDEEETKTSSVKGLAHELRMVSAWVTKTAGEVPVEPPVTGDQTYPTSPSQSADRTPTDKEPLGTAGAVGNTESDPLTTQTQAQPAQTTADNTGKTSSGPAKSQPVAAHAAKVASAEELGAWLRNKIAATPEDGPAAPMTYPTGSGEVGGSEPTDKVPELSGDAAATNMTAQQAENRTWKPDMAPVLQEQPKNHAESGQGEPNVDAKIGGLIREALEAGGV